MNSSSAKSIWSATPETAALRIKFAEAQVQYRAGQFDEALASFATLADRDPVSDAFAARLRGWLAEGEPRPWDGITNLESK